MPSEPFSDVKLEIGHVLFIDIVGYSKLLINEQSEQLQKLKEIVWGTEQFQQAQAEGKLLRLPTGDGGALVFRVDRTPVSTTKFRHPIPGTSGRCCSGGGDNAPCGFDKTLVRFV
jgi:hypothetical protein